MEKRLVVQYVWTTNVTDLIDPIKKFLQSSFEESKYWNPWATRIIFTGRWIFRLFLLIKCYKISDFLTDTYDVIYLRIFTHANESSIFQKTHEPFFYLEKISLFRLKIMQFSEIMFKLKLVFTAQKKWSFPLRISSVNVIKFTVTHLLKKSLMENFIFCAVIGQDTFLEFIDISN